MKTPDSPKLPEAYRNREWDELTPFERDGVIGELLDMAPPGVQRPFIMLADLPAWSPGEATDRVSPAVPRFTQTWVSAMKIVTKLQDQWWWDGQQPGAVRVIGWNIRALSSGNWEVAIENRTLTFARQVGQDLPDTVGRAALEYVLVQGLW